MKVHARDSMCMIPRAYTKHAYERVSCYLRHAYACVMAHAHPELAPIHGTRTHTIASVSCGFDETDPWHPSVRFNLAYVYITYYYCYTTHAINMSASFL